MRRFLAFLFALAGTGFGGYAIYKYDDWKIVAAAFGIPYLASIILLFFTTWGDVAKVVKAAKSEA